VDLIYACDARQVPCAVSLNSAGWPSGQDCFYWPSRGERKRGTIAKSHDEVGTTPWHSDEARQLRSQPCHFDRLIDKGVLETERGGLQRETLASAPCENPMLAVFALRNEDGDASGGAKLPRIFLVIRFGRTSHSNAYGPSHAGNAGLTLR
jgi:hypothetical protein